MGDRVESTPEARMVLHVISTLKIKGPTDINTLVRGLPEGTKEDLEVVLSVLTGDSSPQIAPAVDLTWELGKLPRVYKNPKGEYSLEKGHLSE